ncbi:MAG: hypothetical protein ACYC0G_02950 [Thiobacillus sp.]
MQQQEPPAVSGYVAQRDRMREAVLACMAVLIEGDSFRLAIVVIGGLVSATLLTLVVLPLLYRQFILKGERA